MGLFLSLEKADLPADLEELREKYADWVRGFEGDLWKGKEGIKKLEHADRFKMATPIFEEPGIKPVSAIVIGSDAHEALFIRIRSPL